MRGVAFRAFNPQDSIPVSGSHCRCRTRLLSGSLLLLLLLAAGAGRAQDLTPRAYVITPTSSNAVVLSAAFNTGKILFDPSLPVADASATIQAEILSIYHSFSLLGRSANIVASLPYARGDFSGTIQDTYLSAYRSGLSDMRVRLSVNLRGGPAMSPREYVRWQEKGLIGASLTVVVPSGQYDPAKLLNIGAHRWALKPEVGFTRRRGRWAVDWYAGVWFFTPNDQYFRGDRSRTQAPIYSGEAHVGYYLKPRLWASFDANFWNGGRNTVGGVANGDSQRNSRIGGTASVPINRHHSVKFSYSRGAYVTIGGAFQAVNVGWQYSWIGKPR